MILVTTAGKVGAEATRLLAEREVPVRVLVRDPEKAKALADAGAEIPPASRTRCCDRTPTCRTSSCWHPRSPRRAARSFRQFAADYADSFS
jgi:hypothetical protein